MMQGERITGDGLKPMPSNIELERAVLGALMLDNEKAVAFADLVSEDTFYDSKHKAIIKAIKSLVDGNHPTDMVTVAIEINRQGTKGILATDITNITDMVASSANLEYHCLRLKQYEMSRGLIKVASETLNKAYDETTDVFQALSDTEDALFGITKKVISRDTMAMYNLMPEVLRHIKEQAAKPSGLTGVPSGFKALDAVTSGWQASDFIVIAARPAMGKTAFTLAMALNAAQMHQVPVAVFSLEMSATQLATRLISMDLEISSEKLRQGNLEAHEWQLINAKSEQLSKLPIFIDDTAGISVNELRAKARRLKSKHGIKMLIIDYLQLMTISEGSKGKGNREQEISAISRALKGLAKELNIPIIALSQLSRAVESRANKRPQLSDLRESGAIEQDADIVSFIHRPEYYGIKEDEDGKPLAGIGEIIIAKHRNGALEDVRLNWKAQYAKFTDNVDESVFEGFSMPSEQPELKTKAVEIDDDDMPF